jgi:hypothetical protein
LNVTKLTDMQRVFLTGVRLGRRRARRQAQRDTEDLLDELHERDDRAPYSAIGRLDPDEPQE